MSSETYFFCDVCDIGLTSGVYRIEIAVPHKGFSAPERYELCEKCAAPFLAWKRDHPKEAVRRLAPA